jgi:hypothetical protein
MDRMGHATTRAALIYLHKSAGRDRAIANGRWPDWHYAKHVSVQELARQQGVGPIASVDELARPGTFESDDELDEFLADLYESRRADVA